MSKCQCSGLSRKSCRSWSEFWKIQTLICKEMCKKLLVLTKSCWFLTDGQALVSDTAKRWDLLTHWGRVTHIWVSDLTSIGSDNGLSPGRRQAIIWTNAGILLIGPLGTNFNEILIGIQTFSFKKMHLKVSSAKWRPCCLGLNVLIGTIQYVWDLCHQYSLPEITFWWWTWNIVGEF